MGVGVGVGPGVGMGVVTVWRGIPGMEWPAKRALCNRMQRDAKVHRGRYGSVAMRGVAG